MAKKPTPQEKHSHDLVLKLIALIDKINKDRKPRDPWGQEVVADGIGVERETVSRWIHWHITPRGLSVPAIEKYLDRMEA